MASESLSETWSIDDYPVVDALRRRGRRTPAADALRRRCEAGGIISVDDPIRALHVGRHQALATQLGTAVDLVVAGEPPSVVDGLSPSLRAMLLADAGVTALMGLNGRDRNRVALEGEIAALADLGMPGMLAVSGDPVPEESLAKPVFDLDSVMLAALGHSAGLFVAVAADPNPSRRARELTRLKRKVVAGADVLFVNLTGNPAHVRSLLNQAWQQLGSVPPAIVCVPLAVSETAVIRLSSLTGLAVPHELSAAVDPDRGLISGSNVWELGLSWARRLTSEVMEIPGVIGVHLCPVPEIGSDGSDEVELIRTAVERLRPVLQRNRQENAQ